MDTPLKYLYVQDIVAMHVQYTTNYHRYTYAHWLSLCISCKRKLGQGTIAMHSDHMHCKTKCIYSYMYARPKYVKYICPMYCRHIVAIISVYGQQHDKAYIPTTLTHQIFTFELWQHRIEQYLSTGQYLPASIDNISWHTMTIFSYKQCLLLLAKNSSCNPTINCKINNHTWFTVRNNSLTLRVTRDLQVRLTTNDSISFQTIAIFNSQIMTIFHYEQ